MRDAANDLAQPLAPNSSFPSFIASKIPSVQNTNTSSGRSGSVDLVVGHAGERAERHARQLDLAAAFRVQRIGYGSPEFDIVTSPRLEVEERVAQRAVVLLELALVEDRVHRLQHPRHAEPVGREAAAHGARADELGGERAVERRRRALARHVADRDDERVRFGREEIVEVASELARRLEAAGDVDAVQPLLGSSVGSSAIWTRCAKRSSFSIRSSLRRTSSYSRALSMATAAWLASSVSSSLCSLVNASSSGSPDRTRRCSDP